MDILNFNESFYETFFSSFYGKKPVLIRNFPSMPLNGEQEVLDIIRSRYAAAASKTHRSRIYEGRNLVKHDIENFLPLDDETTMEQCFDRLKRNQHDQVCFSVFSPHVYHQEAFDKSYAMIEPFMRNVGLPSTGVDGEIFAGNYLITPVGIHLDQADTLSCVISGRKKMLLWPFEAFQRFTPLGQGNSIILNALDPEDYMEEAIVLEADPGEMMYWPSSYWHVGVGDGQPVATYNISFYTPSTPSDFIMKAVGRTLTANDRYDRYRPEEVASTELPAAILQVVRSLDDARSELSMKDLIRLEWTRYLSARSYQRLPPVAEHADFDFGRRYQINRTYPLSISVFDSELLCISARGESFLAMNHSIIQDFLARLQGPDGLICACFFEQIMELHGLTAEDGAVLESQIGNIGHCLLNIGALQTTQQLPTV